MGSRVAAAIFQAASARHTGTASFALANVNPAVQFSLLVMMYISIYLIAINIRMSGDYEEQLLGLFHAEQSPDERADGKSCLISHMRNQLSFDLWCIFLGVFCICCSESKKITDRQDYVSIYMYSDNYVTLDTISNTQKNYAGILGILHLLRSRVRIRQCRPFARTSDKLNPAVRPL
jgi:Trk-type K+ transport system membrane component